MIELYGKEHYSDYLYKPALLRQGILSVPGHDYGCGQGNDREIIWKSPDYRVLIVKDQGCTQWSGVGSTEYYPTAYTLYERHLLYRGDTGPTEGRSYVKLGRFEFGRLWSRGQVALTRVALKLEAGEVENIMIEFSEAREVEREAGNG